MQRGEYTLIRILTEAKQDYENFINALVKATPEHDTPEYRAMVMGYLKSDFDSLKQFLPPEQRDIYYWTKQVELDGFRGYNRLAQTLHDVKAQRIQAQSKKEFVKLFPANIVRRFEQNIEGLGKIDRSYQRYSYWVMQAKVDGYDTVLPELEKLLRRFGYSEEEQAKINDGAKLLMTQYGYDVYMITNALAAEYYGQNTGWCICGKYPGYATKGEKFFKEYLDDYNQSAYYFIIKDFKQDSEEDFCILFGETIDDPSRIWEGTRGMDEEIDEEYLPDEIEAIVEELHTKAYGDESLPYPSGKKGQVKYATDYVNGDMELLNNLIHLTIPKMFNIIRNTYSETEISDLAVDFFVRRWDEMSDKQKIVSVLIDVPYQSEDDEDIDAKDPSTYHIVFDREKQYRNAWVEVQVDTDSVEIIRNVYQSLGNDVKETLKAFNINTETIIHWAVYNKDFGTALCKKIANRKRGD